MENKTILKKRLVLKKKVRKFLNQALITIIITLMILIGIKQQPSLKEIIKKKVYEENIDFMKIKEEYKTLFGDYLPVESLVKETKTVFQEKLNYKSLKKNNNGVRLTVDENYLVPSIQDGIVIFIGEKEEYGKCLILEQTDGVDVIYGNLKEINVNLYDYVEQGKLLGETNGNEMYLEFQKEGKPVEYKKYI